MEIEYYHAQEIVEFLYSEKLISLSEYNRITELNRESFSPLYVELFPNPLDNLQKKS